MAQHNLEKTLLNLTRALVAHPDDVKVETSYEDERQIELRLTVNPDDMGRVIGRHGRIARSIRLVIKAASVKAGLRSDVKISEPDGAQTSEAPVASEE